MKIPTITLTRLRAIKIPTVKELRKKALHWLRSFFYHKEAIEELEAADRMRASTRKHNAVLHFVDKLAAQYPEFQPRVMLSTGRLSRSAVTITVHVEDFHMLTPLRRAIRQQGFDKPSFDDFPGSKNRMWTYRRKSDGCGIVIDGYLTSESANCRYVQVGVEERPIFELRCGDDLNGEQEEA